MTEHDKRRIDLAEWYAREAIIAGCSGDTDGVDDAITAACEYLSTLLGRSVRVTEPSEIIALCCQISEGSLPVAA